MERLHYVKAECTSCIRAFGEFPTLLKLTSSEEGGGEKGVRKGLNYLSDYGKAFTQFTSHIEKKSSEAEQGFTGA